MKFVSRLSTAVCVMALTSTAHANAAVLGDLDAGARVPLSKEDLQQLLPGARVVSTNAEGETRRWTNEPGGAFVASTTGQYVAHRGSTARGQWSIADDGRFCVRIDWAFVMEDWCRYVLKSGDDYYAVKSTTAETEVIHKLRISK